MHFLGPRLVGAAGARIMMTHRDLDIDVISSYNHGVWVFSVCQIHLYACAFLSSFQNNANHAFQVWQIRWLIELTWLQPVVCQEAHGWLLHLWVSWGRSSSWQSSLGMASPSGEVHTIFLTCMPGPQVTEHWRNRNRLTVNKSKDILAV